MSIPDESVVPTSLGQGQRQALVIILMQKGCEERQVVTFIYGNIIRKGQYKGNI